MRATSGPAPPGGPQATENAFPSCLACSHTPILSRFTAYNNTSYPSLASPPARPGRQLFAATLNNLPSQFPPSVAIPGPVFAVFPAMLERGERVLGTASTSTSVPPRSCCRRCPLSPRASAGAAAAHAARRATTSRQPASGHPHVGSLPRRPAARSGGVRCACVAQTLQAATSTTSRQQQLDARAKRQPVIVASHPYVNAPPRIDLEVCARPSSGAAPPPFRGGQGAAAPGMPGACCCCGVGGREGQTASAARPVRTYALTQPRAPQRNARAGVDAARLPVPRRQHRVGRQPLLLLRGGWARPCRREPGVQGARCTPHTHAPCAGMHVVLPPPAATHPPKARSKQLRACRAIPCRAA